MGAYKIIFKYRQSCYYTIFWVTCGGALIYSPQLQCVGSLSHFSPAQFPAAAGGYFQSISSGKPTVCYPPSTKQHTDKISKHPVSIMKNSAAKEPLISPRSWWRAKQDQIKYEYSTYLSDDRENVNTNVGPNPRCQTLNINISRWSLKRFQLKAEVSNPDPGEYTRTCLWLHSQDRMFLENLPCGCFSSY